MANYNDLITAIDSVIKTNNRREITGQLLQNVLNTMVGSLGENYQLAGFATPTTNPHQPDQNVFYVASQAGVYTQFDNIVLGDGISFLMWKNGAWTSQTISNVTQSWVQQNFVSKEWLRKVFRVYNEDGLEIVPNDMDSVVDNIKAMVGLWTNEYLSALGMGRDGGGTIQTLAQLNDVQLGTLVNGDALVYNSSIHKWENKQIQTGVDMSVVWAALAENTNEQINASHLATALSGYVTTEALGTALQNYVTQSWVNQNFITVGWFDKLFQLYNGTEDEANKIAPNGALPVDQTQLSIEAMFGFWTKKYISALGQGDDGSAGSGDVTWELLASQATNGRFIHPSYLTQALAGYATNSWVTSNFATITQVNALEFLNQVTGGDGVLRLITNKSTEYDVDLSHEHSFLELLDRPDTIAGYGITLTADDIPMLTKSKISDFPTTWAWTAITGKPTTIAGYGITDAKIVDGVITLGAVNITPITSVAMTVPTGFDVSGSPISKTGTLAVTYASGYEGFTTELKNKINTLFSWFEVDNDGNIKTKDYTDGDTTKHRGFYSPSFISALGQGNDGTAGTGDVTWELLAAQATNNRIIHLSYISSALASYLTTNSYVQSSAISDMATKTWVGQQGYLTSSALANYYTKSEVYTKTEINAMSRVKAIAWSGDGITFTWQDDSTTIADFSHEHSFLELLDRPSTIAGYGISLTADDIPNLPWGKITSGKPTTIGGYGITDAVTSVKVGTTSYAPASGIVSLPAYPTNYYSNTDSHTSNTVLAAPNGSNGVATFRALVAADIPMLTKSKISDFPTSWAWSALTGVPTTIAGYGITDAKIVDGVITLGVNTITPVTSVAMSVPTGFSISGSPISKTGTLAVSYASGYEGFTTTLKNKIDLLYSLFTREGSGTSADPYIIKANYGLYTEKFLSALGKGDDGSAGVGDVTWALLASQATDDRTIHPSYLTQALSGYATQSWVTNQSYATQTWVTGQGYATSASVTAAIGALTYFNAAALVTDGTIKLSGHGVEDAYLDFTHEHSWFDLVDRPSTLTGFGITVTASDIPNLDWSKITTGKPTTLVGYGITDAVASIVINGTSYLPTNKVVTLPVYTSTQVDAMARLKTLTLSGDRVLSFTHQDNSTSVVDFSHDHTFLELLDRPTSIKGYGITILESDVPNLSWSKITSGKPTTIAGYGITDAITTGNIGSQSVNYATTAGTANGVSWGNVSNKPSAAGNGTTPVYWTGSGFTACTPYSSASVNYANSAGNADTVDGYHYSSFLLVSGGDMNSGARISFSGGNGYLGNASNAGWLMVQDMCSQNSAGDGVWSIRTNGNAIFQNVTSYGAVSALSDIRHKEIVRDTNLQVEQIAAMRSVIYRKKESNDNTLYAGSIAQDWQGILPQVVSVADNDEHTQSLQYGVAALIAVITTARKVAEHEQKIKEQAQKISELEQVCSFLKKENIELKDIVKKLNVV